jgi:hypothetical protein
MKKLKLKAPELLEQQTKVRTDTVYLTDVFKDTVTVFKENVRDSIIFQDKTVVSYLIRRDTIELQVDCPDQIVVTDSVFVTKTVTVKESFYKKALSLWWLLVIGLFIGLAFVVVIRR